MRRSTTVVALPGETAPIRRRRPLPGRVATTTRRRFRAARPAATATRWRLVLAVVAVVVGLSAACAGPTDGDDGRSSATSRPPATAAGSAVPATPPDLGEPATTSPTAGAGDGGPASISTGEVAVDAATFLAPLALDDRADPPVRYDRGAWPHWDDVDGDGCDARQQALRAASTTPAQVDPYGCTVLAGDWTSAYDGWVTSDPTELDVDHVVPLTEAHRSGGWAWPVERRRAFANDQANLWVVSATANRQKGASGPQDWRPAVEATWCGYATRWVTVKVAYGLTATTDERDALGRMLDTCPSVPAAPATSVAPLPPLSPPTSPPSGPGADLPFATCAAARAAGAAPLTRDEPGYGPHLDGDDDGIACE